MKRMILAIAVVSASVVSLHAQTTTDPTPPANPAVTAPTTATPPPAATDATPKPATTGTVDANAPLEGANSFTESQVRSRLEANGFSNVAGLAKDAKGIWRGTASFQGKSTGVAVDYRGNIVRN